VDAQFGALRASNMDQITYNEKLRNGGLMSLPIGTCEQGIDWHFFTTYQPRPDRDEVAGYLRNLFEGDQSCEHSGKKCEQAGSDLRAAAMSTGVFSDGSVCGSATQSSWWYWSGIQS
jgi:hypothetical protein